MKKTIFWILLSVVTLSLTGCFSDPPEVNNPTIQLEKDNALIDQYIADNELEVMTDTNGYELRYVLHEQGDGARPLIDRWMLLDYQGVNIASGAQFASFDSVFVPLTRSTLTGWQILVPYVLSGGEITMLLPSIYAHGMSGSPDGKVPPNTPVAYSVALHEIYSQLEYELLIIDQYLEDNEIGAQVDSASQIRYVIHEAGDGDYPQVSDVINVTYEGSLLPSETVFDKGTAIDFSLQSLIKGWQIILPLIKERGKVTMYLPSNYGYGSSGAGQIPPNAQLIFEVTLNRIVE